ncbi:hypothetical protein HU200_053126 [Digitaria exilis]|uniref:R13L1/DRL21-like LRR repeat region domain-containing protein n=1 Tax=Digitaria exilis TaxID=1010633 RepID=A0A835E3M1_9POAL|nr:hypothetical protein HU200_053126 [Digitaria exilis]
MASPAGLSALRFLDCQGTELHGSAFEAAGSLRVLDLSECSIQKLPDSVGRLKQLRSLRELEPPYSVLEFSLEGYNSVSFPPWVMRLNDYLPGLIEVEMSDLPSCNNLPPLGQLPNLTYLYIRRMNSIKKIGMDLYGGARAFPRLEQFHINGMKCLEEWNMIISSDEDGLNEPMFPQLCYVSITHCPRLRFKPCPDSKQKLPNLHTLEMQDCESIISLPDWVGDKVHIKHSKEGITPDFLRKVTGHHIQHLKKNAAIPYGETEEF